MGPEISVRPEIPAGFDLSPEIPGSARGYCKCIPARALVISAGGCGGGGRGNGATVGIMDGMALSNMFPVLIVITKINRIFWYHFFNCRVSFLEGRLFCLEQLPLLIEARRVVLKALFYQGTTQD